MDLQYYMYNMFIHSLSLMLIVMMLLISDGAVILGFPHNRAKEPGYAILSNHSFITHRNRINSGRLNKKQQSYQSGSAYVEYLEKYLKKQSIEKNTNSIRQALYLGNKQGTDSHIRYLPRNLEKYSAHSKQKEVQKVGNGDVLDADSGKHVSHPSVFQSIQSIGTISEHKTYIQNTKLPHLNTGQSQTSDLPKRDKRQPKNHLQKRHVIVSQLKDRINFAVVPTENVTSDYRIGNMIIAVGAGIVALSMGIVLGIFGCCCKKKKVENEKDKEEQSAIINTAEDVDKGLPDAQEDLGTKKEDEPKSIKDKIKAFENENKFILPARIDVTPQGKIRNSEAFTALEGKQLFSGLTKPSQMVVREEQDDSKSKDEGLGDTTESKTEDLSKSDTHEEVSEIAMDNTSTHSSISQPHNPDVVIASDDEDEFADIQRGTVILKSFQRAKPPRNRSPATRSNRKLRQKSPGHPKRSDRNSPDTSAGNDSISPMMSQSLFVESSSEKLDSAKDKSGSVPDNLDRLEPVSISKSLRNSNGEIQNQAKSKGGSSQELDKKDISSGARYAKNKDSPLIKPKYRKKEKESESTTESDTRKRISLSELENKQKELPSAIDNKSKIQMKDSRTPERQVKTEDQSKTAETENNVKRLSGLPANVNNIFYLIDPTVKDKCRSVGDVTASNNRGKSKDSANKKDKAYKHKAGKDDRAKEEGDVRPQKRDRTHSDPQRHSREMENTAL